MLPSEWFSSGFPPFSGGGGGPISGVLCARPILLVPMLSKQWDVRFVAELSLVEELVADFLFTLHIIKPACHGSSDIVLGLPIDLKPCRSFESNSGKNS